MGCGQSKILIYHRKSKTEKSDKNNYAKDDSDASDSHPDAEATGSTEAGGPDQSETESSDLSSLENSSNLLDNSEISHSQLDFFKMLDEKIENGPDYEEDDIEREQERLRLRRLLQDWLRKPQVDTQRFPTAYQPCPPPTRTPHRVCPRPPIYPQARAYMFTRASSVETSEMQYQHHHQQQQQQHQYHHQDPYMEARREEAAFTYGYAPAPEQYSIPAEVNFGYNRVPYDSPELYARNRVMLNKAPGGVNRALSFDVNTYGRVENQDFYASGSNNDYLPRAREMHYPPLHHLPQYGSIVQYQDMGQEPIQHMVRPPPRELAPLQGAPGPPGHPHGSPRPLAVRLPTGTTWRRPRGPVTELA